MPMNEVHASYTCPHDAVKFAGTVREAVTPSTKGEPLSLPETCFMRRGQLHVMTHPVLMLRHLSYAYVGIGHKP